MQRIPTDTGAAPDAANRHVREQDDDRAPYDPTVVRFDGSIQVSADDRGSDPYNRTGSFKRLVR